MMFLEKSSIVDCSVFLERFQTSVKPPSSTARDDESDEDNDESTPSRDHMDGRTHTEASAALKDLSSAPEEVQMATLMGFTTFGSRCSWALLSSFLLETTFIPFPFVAGKKARTFDLDALVSEARQNALRNDSDDSDNESAKVRPSTAGTVVKPVVAEARQKRTVTMKPAEGAAADDSDDDDFGPPVPKSEETGVEEESEESDDEDDEPDSEDTSASDWRVPASYDFTFEHSDKPVSIFKPKLTRLITDQLSISLDFSYYESFSCLSSLCFGSLFVRTISLMVLVMFAGVRFRYRSRRQ